jgi:CRP-like cAMP-binding protein
MDAIEPKYLNTQFGAQQLALHVPFKGLPHEVLAAIYGQGQVLKVDAFSNIIVEGETSAGMYIVFEGMVGVYKSESASRRGALLKTLGVGQAFGEMSLIDRAPRSATVSAEVDCVLFELSAKTWDVLVAASPEWGLKLYQNFSADLATRVRAINDELIVSQRLLWRHAFALGLKNHDGPPPPSPSPLKTDKAAA